MRKAIIYLFYYELMQRKWGRKYIGGKFYLIDPRGLSMAPFWSDEIIKSCQSIVLEIEEYPIK